MSWIEKSMLRALCDTAFKSAPLLLSVAIASGQFRLILFCGILYALCAPRSFLAFANPIAASLVVFCLLLLLFFQVPVSQDYKYLTFIWLSGLVASVCFSYYFGYHCKSLDDARLVFFFVAVVLFLFGAISIFATMVWMQPPYYGQVLDIVHWGAIGSGSRVSEFMLLLPILFCGLLVYKSPRKSLFNVVLSLTVLSLALNVFLEKRIFYFTVFVLLPILFLFLNKRLNVVKNTGFGILVLCLTGAIFFILYDHLIQKFFLEYSRNGGRVWLYESFFQQLASGHGTQVTMPRSLTDAPLWFHNIFMDIYRISGPWAALSLIGLFVVFAQRLLTLASRQPLAARLIACWFLPLFFIANVSVVPEGEPQFLLLMVFLMGVTERMLHQTDLGTARSV